MQFNCMRELSVNGDGKGPGGIAWENDMIERLQRVWGELQSGSGGQGFRFDLRSIGTRLAIAFLTVSLLTVLAAVVGNLGFSATGSAVGSMANERLPRLIRAFELAETSAQFNGEITALASDRTDRARSWRILSLRALMQDLEEKVAAMSAESGSAAEGLQELQAMVAGMPDVVDPLNGIVKERIHVTLRMKTKLKRADGHLLTLREELNRRHGRSSDPFERETLMQTLAYANAIVVDYAEVITADAEKQVATRQKSYDAAVRDFELNIGALVGAISADASNAAEALVATGQGQSGIFELKTASFEFDARAAELIESAEETKLRFAELVTAYVMTIGAEAGAAAEATLDQVASSKFVLIGLSLLAILVSAGILWFYVLGQVAARLGGLAASMQHLAKGDLDVTIAGTEAADEIGEMARAVEVFRESGIERRRLEEAQAQDAEARARRSEKLDAIIAAFDGQAAAALDTVERSAATMQDAAEAMTGIAQRTSDESSAVAQVSETASSNVETVASAAEELAASIQEISLQVEQSTSVAGNAVDQVERTNTDVGRLIEAADRIGDVVTLIDQIAHQTNLLALNATIEAARAGESGKGFAVVASEVKTLANQTSNATKTIVDQITEMRVASEASVSAMQAIANVIAEMREITGSIAKAVDQQRNATQEISRNVQEVAAGTGEVTSKIAEVDAAAGETGQSAQAVLETSNDLAGASHRLKEDVAAFLSDVRAA